MRAVQNKKIKKRESERKKEKRDDEQRKITLSFSCDSFFVSPLSSPKPTRSRPSFLSHRAAAMRSRAVVVAALLFRPSLLRSGAARALDEAVAGGFASDEAPMPAPTPTPSPPTKAPSPPPPPPLILPIFFIRGRRRRHLMLDAGLAKSSSANDTGDSNSGFASDQAPTKAPSPPPPLAPRRPKSLSSRSSSAADAALCSTRASPSPPR